ncbi:hypothetical protein COLO4_20861 [Corchorus olitorius]|uniref:Uncharacterized protein n=1 Tax=Corchorus olitorius TaxID=93759 RepID=A0A1R3IWF6_9ROSI|nr:hypothetical protein COLO4_20861 [Corchorus olitorius]
MPAGGSTSESVGMEAGAGSMAEGSEVDSTDGWRYKGGVKVRLRRKS